MYNHAPQNYACPFCRLARQSESDDVACTVYHNDAVTAFIPTHKWPNNPGHVIIIPNEHYENIYDLPLHLATKIHGCARAVAVAMKAAYSCDGISTRQHNEPDGGQDVWHYHLHVFPRYKGDLLYASRREPMTADERHEYACKLRAQLKDWKPSV
jgi:histidine triad (HIT) family protein